MPVRSFVGPLDMVFDVDIAADAIVSSALRPPRHGDSLVSSRAREPLLRDIARQLRAYDARALRTFTLPLQFVGTQLQREIWRAVSEIPFGMTVAYGEIARAIGAPGAHRAVAAAMGCCEHALLVPAHRVIGADGSIKGAGPGSLRRRLLAFEGIVLRG